MGVEWDVGIYLSILIYTVHILSNWIPGDEGVFKLFYIGRWADDGCFLTIETL